ncbi:MAG: porphobilinogen synthase [Myxococcales bacterium]|nr:porphobilinogen synthase [Myxococcales bacterium]
MSDWKNTIDRTPLNLPTRPRRNRRSDAIRRLVRETHLSVDDLIQPLFVVPGEGREEPIGAMPGCAHLSLDRLAAKVERLASLGVPAVALFPALPDDIKDPVGTESANPEGLMQRAIRACKDAAPGVMVVGDVALDPYSSDGHDGVVEDGEIINDPSVHILCEMAVSQAEAGVDIIAPSDMMDGRVGAIRDALDDAGHTDVLILSYCAKYASAFYGPFREALDSAPRAGDKKTYQMDPANAREAEREAMLDEEEGADILMVKPALPYLDVIYRLREVSNLPIAAYHVSGGYASLMAAGQRGWLDADKALAEALLGIKRAGADMILTYYAERFAERA